MARLPTKRSDTRRANTQDETGVDAGTARSQWGEDFRSAHLDKSGHTCSQAGHVEKGEGPGRA